MNKPAIGAVAIVLAVVIGGNARRTARADQDYGLPELHKIMTATLSPSYSCRSAGTGYENTALFLSSYSRQRNSPDLLFNGACGSDDYFEASTAGDDMALIADLGRVSLEEVTAQRSFNLQNVASFSAYSLFAQSVPVRKKHTYAVLLNKREIRGLFLFTVTRYAPNQLVELRHAVKEYQILDLKAQSPGFDWAKPNS